MQFLRSNTATIVAVGPFYDKGDGVTIETALTITNERITLIAETDAGSAPTLILDNITGATSATANDLNYIASGDNGMMQLELAAADVNRVGRMKLSITDAANHVPVFHEYFVLPAAIFDWLTGVIVPLPANVTTIAGAAVSTTTAQLGVNAVQAGATVWGSGAITAGAIAADAITAAKIADGAIDAATFAAGAINAAAIASDAITDAKVASDVTIASVTGSVGSVTGAVGSVTGAVGSVTGLTAANLDAAISTRATPAQVNTEVLDVLNTDTFAEPGQEAPPATTTLVKKIGYLYKFLRNRKTQTTTTLSLYADNATTVDQKATISDNGTTYDHGEVATGP